MNDRDRRVPAFDDLQRGHVVPASDPFRPEKDATRPWVGTQLLLRAVPRPLDPHSVCLYPASSSRKVRDGLVGDGLDETVIESSLLPHDV